MTEREILDLQEQTGGRECYLVLVGSFVHAYGSGAFALSRATGYRVMRKPRRQGEVLTVGFPVGRLEQVCRRLREAGGEVEQRDDRTWLFRGLDGTPDALMVCEPRPKSAPAPAPPPSGRPEGGGGYAWLAEALRGFNLSLSTPMEAMLLIGTLQQRLKESDDDAKEKTNEQQQQ